MKSTLCAAVALVAALGATPALAEDFTDHMLRQNSPECQKPASELTVREQKDCAAAVRIYESVQTTFDEAHRNDPEIEARRQRARERAAEDAKNGQNAVQVCGTDHWVKDHWEPSCR